VVATFHHGEPERLHAATSFVKVGDENDRLYEGVAHDEILTCGEGGC
jgi:hypothetical protein